MGIGPLDAAARRQEDVKSSGQFYIKTKMVNGREVAVLKYGKPSVSQAFRKCFNKSNYQFGDLHTVLNTLENRKIEDINFKDKSLPNLSDKQRDLLTNFFAKVNASQILKSQAKSFIKENNIPALVEFISSHPEITPYDQEDIWKNLNEDQKKEFSQGIIKDIVKNSTENDPPLRVSSSKNYRATMNFLCTACKERPPSKELQAIFDSAPKPKDLSKLEQEEKIKVEATMAKEAEQVAEKIIKYFAKSTSNLPQNSKIAYQQYYQELKDKYGVAVAKNIVKGCISSYLMAIPTSDALPNKMGTLIGKALTVANKGKKSPEGDITFPYQAQMDQIFKNLGIPIEFEEQKKG